MLVDGKKSNKRKFDGWKSNGWKFVDGSPTNGSLWTDGSRRSQHYRAPVSFATMANDNAML